MDAATLLWGVLFGGIGIGYFMYGRRQKKLVSSACGMALIGLPYLVTNDVWLVIASLLVMAVPFVFRR